jgi:hypothetical protein
MVALVMKAMTAEQEIGAVSHDATLQLLFTTGLLPRNVAVPEWIQFGMSSFFETPPESPWTTTGAPSFYWLPRFKELRKLQKLEADPAKSLRQVVTDSYFRTIPSKGNTEATQAAFGAAQRKARATAWALAYFLAQEKLDSLERYFKELNKLPRDMELAESLLLECFARAVGAVDRSGKPDDAALSALANRWFAFMDNVSLENEEMAKQIELFHKSMILAERLKETIANTPGAGRPGGGGRFGGGAGGAPAAGGGRAGGS